MDNNNLQELDTVAKMLVRRDFELSGVRIRQEEQIKELDRVAKMLVRRDFELFQTTDILRIRDEQIAFVSLASHQLKTPLTTIKWHIEMLNGGYAGALMEKQERYLATIYSNVQRMISLVDALLNASRLELGAFVIKKKPINMRGEIESAIRDLAFKIKDKGLKLHKAFPKNIPIILADPEMTQVLLVNLVSNAVKYTPRGGSISIGLRKKDDSVVVEVADTGMGIPEEQQSKVFTKFFRADNAVSQKIDGTGLGLYIVKTIVEKMGGKIWFKSPAFVNKTATGAEKRTGTTFYVVLPR